VLLQRGEHATAATYLETLARDHPDDRYVQFLLGTAYRGLRRLDDAKAALARGRGAEPDWRDPWLDEVGRRFGGVRAVLFAALDALRRADGRRAIELLEPQRAERPDDLDVVIALARGYRMTGRPADAISLLEQTEAVFGEAATIHFQLAASYRQQAQTTEGDDAAALLDEAVDRARRLVALRPSYAPGHAMAGEVRSVREGPEAALAGYRRARQLDPDEPQWPRQAGTLLCRAGRWSEAVAPLEAARRLDPGDTQSVYLLAAALANSGRTREAQSLLESAMRSRPDDPTLREALSRVIRAAGAVEDR
jgi:predicted Zn-dependent protease